MNIYQAKVSLDSRETSSGKVTEYYLVEAFSFAEAYELLEDYTGAYRLLSIVETPVLDFLQHASPSQAEA